MREFDPLRFGPAAADLIQRSEPIPLDAGEPNRSAYDTLKNLGTAELFTRATVRDPQMAEACLSALWLLHGFLDESHSLSQRNPTAEGSYWHGIMHRREGDFPNAKYWFRRVGPHKIHSGLAAAAREFASGASAGVASSLTLTGTWDSGAFVDLCQRSVGGGPEKRACEEIQRREWTLLFEHCYQAAIGETGR